MYRTVNINLPIQGGQRPLWQGSLQVCRPHFNFRSQVSSHSCNKLPALDSPFAWAGTTFFFPAALLDPPSGQHLVVHWCLPQFLREPQTRSHSGVLPPAASKTIWQAFSNLEEPHRQVTLTTWRHGGHSPTWHFSRQL